MIRLYDLREFHLGDVLELKPEEIHYYQKVRRGRGDIELFNQMGQRAHGVLKGSSFNIQKVFQTQQTRSSITVVVGMPEVKVITDLIRPLTELGIENLVLTEAQRSQRFSERKLPLDRWSKISLEACRQSGAARPLKVDHRDWTSAEFLSGFKSRYFMDEAPVEEADLGAKSQLESGPLILLVGPEGGWTIEERDIARQNGFRSIHFPVPVLRVETAVLCAAFWGLMKLPSDA